MPLCPILRFNMWAKHKQQSGFTIVELLIVIVVIGILAAITIVAYNGIQTRARTTSITSAAQQIQKLLLAYKNTYGTYPTGGGGFCLTADNSCTNFAGSVVTSDNSSLLAELRKVGNPPQSIPHFDPSFYGLYYDNYDPRTYNHNRIPVLLMYWLPPNQTCSLGDTTVSVASSGAYAGEPNPFITSTTGYTTSDSSRTACWVSI